MNGKGNFNKKQAEIIKNISKYRGKSVVFICYDIDESINDSLNQNIINYSKNNNYEIIWFYEDIEQVFIKTSVPANLKSKRAKQFVAHNGIKNVDEINLNQPNVSRRNSSNILCVLDNYLTRN